MVGNDIKIGDCKEPILILVRESIFKKPYVRAEYTRTKRKTVQYFISKEFNALVNINRGRIVITFQRTDVEFTDFIEPKSNIVLSLRINHSFQIQK